MIQLGSIRHLHLVGIGGVGMCALAEVLLEAGFVISGSDEVASERTRRLSERGARVHIGHHHEHVAGAHAVVVTSAVDHSNEEVAAAVAAGLPVVRRSVLLGEVLRGSLAVAVAGTHGKTTTTALLGHLLVAADLDPTIIAGGHLKGLNGHARFGHGEVTVCEADEFDRSFLDLHPVHAIVTNVEPEHLDTYGSAEEMHRAFANFAERVPFHGRLVVCADDPGAAALGANLDHRTLTYGVCEHAQIRAQAITSDPTSTRFEVVADGLALGTVELPLAGRHNLLNTLAAMAVGLELGVDFDRLAEAVADFPGVARRFDRRGERDGVVVVDDYAHHPTEVTAALAAARQVFPQRRLVAVFQPHLFSRTRDFASGFGAALAEADLVVLLPIYAAREKPLAGVSSELVAQALTNDPRPTDVISVDDADQALAALNQHCRKGDVMITLGAGDVFMIAEAWLGRAA